MNRTFISSLACHWLRAFTTPPANSSPPSTSVSSPIVPPLHNTTDSKNSTSYSHFITHHFSLYFHHHLLDVAFLFPIHFNYLTLGLWHGVGLKSQIRSCAGLRVPTQKLSEIIHKGCPLLKHNKSLEKLRLQEIITYEFNYTEQVRWILVGPCVQLLEH